MTLGVLLKLEERFPEDVKLGGFSAADLAVQFPGLKSREKPAMTVASYLTHLRNEGCVERKQSSDKRTAWWRSTPKGRKAYASAQEASG